MSALSSLASTWKSYDIASLQNRLDQTAETVLAGQSASEESRPKLVEQLEAFFQDADLAEAKAAAGPIIKLFQQEIDQLDSRCVSAEGAFLEAWKSVGSMADPVSTLEAAAEKAAKVNSKLTDSDLVIAQLRETVSLYEEEIVVGKKRDKELQKLKTKLEAYDRNIDATLNERMVEVTQRLTQEADDRVKEVTDEKAAAERKFEDLKTEMNSQRRALENAQTELFDHHQRQSELNDARAAETELLQHDLEAWQQRAEMAEKHAESLQQKLRDQESAAGESGSNSRTDSEWVDLQSTLQELQNKVGAKEREIERLVTQLTETNNHLSTEQDRNSSEKAELEKRLNEMSALAQESSDKLEQMSDYETLKKELGILRSHEFSSTGGETEGEPVEVLILKRSKHVQSENTTLRMDKERLSKALDETTEELAEKCREFEKQAMLVAELEMHVDKLQQIRSNQHVESGGGRSSVDILRDISPSANFSPSSATPDLQAATDRTTPQGTVLNSHEATQGQDSSNMLPIVQAQRERYRQRNQELEEEKAAAQQQMQVAQAQVKQLSTDNLKLYEKIRFLQSPVNQQRSRSTNVEVEARYHSQYEQRLDPFTSFSNQERQKRYGNLNFGEKFILWMVRFMMSNKIARLMIFAYSVFLHILVFFVLMRMAYTESHARQVAEGMAWKQRLEDHMRDHHEDHQNLPHG